jgi:hypothetical protein
LGQFDFIARYCKSGTYANEQIGGFLPQKRLPVDECANFHKYAKNGTMMVLLYLTMPVAPKQPIPLNPNEGGHFATRTPAFTQTAQRDRGAQSCANSRTHEHRETGVRGDIVEDKDADDERLGAVSEERDQGQKWTCRGLMPLL